MSTSDTRLKSYKLNFALDKVPTSLTDEESLIYNLIEEIANDSNSSKFREDVVKWMVGLEASEGKHGYDDDFAAIEVKPKNFTGKSKLNGGGQFNDFTWKRDEKYSSDDVTMLCAGFSHGKLMFIVEFKYSTIQGKIQTHLNRILPDGDLPNRYVRSASFSYLDWKDSFEIKYMSPNFDSFKSTMVAGLYRTLKDKC
jgi:hypothetical protein